MKQNPKKKFNRSVSLVKNNNNNNNNNKKQHLQQKFVKLEKFRARRKTTQQVRWDLLVHIEQKNNWKKKIRKATTTARSSRKIRSICKIICNFTKTKSPQTIRGNMEIKKAKKTFFFRAKKQLDSVNVFANIA